MAFGLLIVWYVPRKDSRFAAFIRAVPKGTAMAGLALHFINLLCCYYIFIHFGFLVDAAAIFIILSAVMGCFFSSSLLHAQERAKAEAEAEAAQAAVLDAQRKESGESDAKAPLR